jgi:hypothetical protein
MTPLPPMLSVDVDAQMRKLPARRFLRPEHYLVEWVRGALARGATRITIDLGRRQVRVVDDGEAIDATLLSHLVAALTPQNDEARRRAGLEPFEQGEGLEILAALAPERARADLESGPGPEGRFRWRLRIGHAPVALPPRGGAGSALTVQRRGNARAERAALGEYVRFAPAEVVVDGVPLPSGPPPDALAYSRLEVGPDIAHLWLPASGDTCRLWTTRFGVRQQQRVMPAANGLVFHAALEGGGHLSPDVLQRLRQEALALYRGVAHRYASLPDSSRERVDELLFLLHRHNAPRELLDAFKVFRRLDVPERLSLSQVMALAGPAEAVYALRLEESRRHFDLSGRVVLRLSAAQWDFLSERVGLRLARPPAQVRRKLQSRLRWQHLLANLRYGWVARRVAAREVVAPPEETHGLADLLQEHTPQEVDVEWRAGRGWLPTILLKSGDRPTLVLFAHHPELTRAARDLQVRPHLGPLWAARLLRGNTRPVSVPGRASTVDEPSAV